MFDEYIPDVEIVAYCPLCEQQLNQDHYWFCAGCLIRWEPDGSEGEMISEEEFESYDDDYS